MSDPDTIRHIIHVDMDAFYASVEQRDFPQFRGKPVIVGGDPQQRGVVAACSYEARRYGIHSAMPSVVARQKCPHGIFCRPRFDAYRQASQQIRQVLERFSDQIEPLALDEAYIDVTDIHQKYGSAMLIAKDMRSAIYQRTQLTASAGVSYNKFFAKIASARCKPNGQMLISNKQGPEFVQDLKIEDFYGVGASTAAKMHALGIYTGADLMKWDLSSLVGYFGKSAHYFYWAARGVDRREVEADRMRKSVSTEDTFPVDLTSKQEMLVVLNKQAEQVWKDLQKLGYRGRTLTIKVKFYDFTQVTRSVTQEQYYSSVGEITIQFDRLLSSALNPARAVRLLGVSISSFESEVTTEPVNQLTLFKNR